MHIVLMLFQFYKTECRVHGFSAQSKQNQSGFLFVSPHFKKYIFHCIFISIIKGHLLSYLLKP